MDLLEKREHYSNLFDFYQTILTEKQQKYFREYYFDDLSLSEIGYNNGVSRNAVFDQLRTIQELLDSYEEKLGLYRKFLARTAIYNEYSTSNDQTMKQMLQKLKEIE